ncbi:dihydrolipoamide acetyltransferase family protein [Peribacillus frigoritolerans]|uniref:dihydrolipoamide acetyltransferase family protein n=1 Tax=Peribacillus frigoritolerans TaxID=450367 RepID=UPI001927F463|nr:dihydrolipoamide acetyltransferase family protein [Peribacillus frigoritolerans]MBL3642136.1 2-oxo acid dehydrogenase subunit E2 [Bacillus sp. RHFB]MCK2003364.1 2-oxo acid dehydrogenase subunit E2 [Peribacillus frigoritolerans]MEE3953234.1 dihydrolipoamide acetyltransferase family protein [Peribacillus frigoritolerans]
MAMELMKMPQLGESVTEGTISKWLVKPGDHVTKYDPLAEVMTDKVNAEVPSSFTGIIKELKADENQTLAVGEVICSIEVETAKTDNENAGQVSHNEEKVDAPVTRDVQQAAETSSKARYSPAVLKLSQEHGIDLSKVKGTGNEGRITRKDLLKLVESGNLPKADEPSAISDAAPEEIAPQVNRQTSPVTNVPTAAGDKEIPVTGIRKAIASNMLKSKHEIPHAWTMVEVDASNMVKLRDNLKSDFKQKEGYNLTYFAFFVKAVAQALTEFPELNSMWAGEKIIQKKEINISIAVATEDALFVPVIKNADEKSIKGIAREIQELASKVKSGKLKAEDMQGGTFTVNNTGSFGSVQSMGIINYPQAAILQVETIVKRPVVINDMIAVRDMVNLCLSLDHRVLDGLVCGRFLARVKEIIEKISKDNTPIY